MSYVRLSSLLVVLNNLNCIYKVVKYYKEAGQSGLVVWRCVLRRADPQASDGSQMNPKRRKGL